MNQDSIVEIAELLTSARLKCDPVEQLSETYKDLTEEAAYKIQRCGIEHRIDRGEKLIGLKMGLTSEAKRKQMDLHSPLYGELTDKMQVMNEGLFRVQQTIHSKIEPEIAFLTNKELRGKITREEALAACEGVAPALEILDSRYSQFKYFSLEDVISDNSSSSHFIVGEWSKDLTSRDLVNLDMSLIVNGEVAHSGKSNAISGDPLLSVVQLCELLEKNNRSLPAGSIVLAGAATAAVALERGMIIELNVETFPENIRLEVV